MVATRRIARAATGTLAAVAVLTGCSGSKDTATNVAVDVTAGGTYRVEVGSSVMLTGTAVASGQAETNADLERIGAALRAYEADHGSYPPAHLTDASGRPTVSWRVLLLPYLGGEALYAKFDLARSWDDPVNRPLLDQMPDIYRGDGPKRATNTAYAGVAGPQQVFRGGASELGGGVRRDDVVDGTTMTSAVGPVGASASIPWSAPQDIAEADHPRLGDAKGFDGPGTSVTPMLFLDGTVQPLLDATDPQSVRSWTTIAGDACAPPNQHALRLSSAWDLDGDGTYEAAGPNASYAATAKGTRNVKLRVVDGFGGVHLGTATVVVG